ncbi:protein-disulfide isomerase [Neomicrococcus aestuarii]|uniref:Protein-disulfide isomerase n=1 Tax=Neomicrococcus aestuarii TaxID=556325 RepID=A0A7W8TT01_9MICC|nr:thioredoxin domain-containing protein [Neomicrococcus aestuarii]MBB5512336.1 protein-disulfide isomerase [Neomicrococcus aestuarii]
MANNSPTPRGDSAAACEKARQFSAQQAASQKRKGLWVKIGVLVAVVAIIAIVAAIVLQQNKGQVADAGPVPAGGNTNGGITLVTSTELASTESGQTVDLNNAGATPTAAGTPAPRGVVKAEAGDPLQLIMYVDANCVYCADFESEYGDDLKTWLDAKDITLEYRNVAFLDRGSPTNYSSRGANAFACVANEAPASYFSFATAVFAHHAEGEMTNAELAQMAKDNGADVESCIEDGTYRPFVKYTTQAALADSISGTPSMFLNGEEWNGTSDPDFKAWAQSIIDAHKG